MPEEVTSTSREETGEEKAVREWFEKQALASPDNLEAAARLLIGLATGLLAVLFGVLSLKGGPLPAYLQSPLVRGLGIFTVLAVLWGLLAALAVVMPDAYRVSSQRPDEQHKTFQQLLGRKSRALTLGVIGFGVGIVLLGFTLIAALISAGTG
jgi:hypothetical protein